MARALLPTGDVRVWLGLLLAIPGVASAQSDPVPLDGRELPRGAWPAVSLEDLRGMRECTLEDPPARSGAPIACRPPVLPSRSHVSLEAGWTTGLVLDGDELRGMHGLALSGDYWVTRSLGLGGRYVLAGVAAATPMAGAPRMGRSGEALAGLRLRWFTDEIDRDAFGLSLAAGYAMRDEALGGGEPIARAALSREIGYMTGERSSITWAWEVAYQHGLGDPALRAITAGVRAGAELGIREPRNLHERDRDPPLRYSLGGEFRGSPHVGMGASLGLGLGRRAAWRTTVFWTAGRDEDGSHGLRATWGAVTGPRVRLLRDAQLSPYADLQAGPAAIGGDPSARLGVLAEAEGGFDVQLGCQTRLEMGGRIQTELDGGVSIRTGFFMLRVEHGTALRERGEPCGPGPSPVARYRR